MASTDGKNIRLDLKPGISRRSTSYSQEGGWYDCDRVRFRTGSPENMRGWEKASQTRFDGYARGTLHWEDTSGLGVNSFGTHTRLNVFADSSVWDITPVQSSTSANSIFSATSSSPYVLVSLTAHGTDVSSGVVITNMVATIGGNIFLNGTYVVTSVAGVDSFYINARTTAAATSASGSGAHIDILLPAGGANDTGGYGWGAGTWGHLSGWGAAASTTNIPVEPRTWALDNWGFDMVASPHNGGVYFWNTSIGVSTRAYRIDGTPSRVSDLLVSPEARHLVLFGVTDHDTSVFDPLLIRWSDSERLQVWQPAVTNAAGSMRIQAGTHIVGSERSRNQILIWTDESLHSMAYTGPPFVFSFRLLGVHCGLAGKNAAVEFNGRTYWMSEHNFHVYDGGVRVLDCPVYNKIFDDIDLTQSAKIFSGVNEEFSEVIWLYPSSSAMEPDRYVIYNTLEELWYYGSFPWTAWIEQGAAGDIITFGSDNYVRYHEVVGVFTSDGGNMAAYIESADLDLGDGDEITYMDRFIPDFEMDDNAQVDLTFSAKSYPNGSYTVKGPYGVAVGTRKVDFRLRGRQWKFKIANPAAGNVGQWRYGSGRLNIQPDGRR